jgi:hypothetical protein
MNYLIIGGITLFVIMYFLVRFYQQESMYNYKKVSRTKIPSYILKINKAWTKEHKQPITMSVNHIFKGKEYKKHYLGGKGWEVRDKRNKKEVFKRIWDILLDILVRIIGLAIVVGFYYIAWMFRRG